MKKIIGIIMLVGIFGYMFYYTSKEIGYKQNLKLWAISLLITSMIVGSLFLIIEG